MSYSDVLTIISFAPVDSLDIADRILARLELESRAARLLAHVSRKVA